MNAFKGALDLILNYTEALYKISVAINELGHLDESLEAHKKLYHSHLIMRSCDPIWVLLLKSKLNVHN